MGVGRPGRCLHRRTRRAEAAERDVVGDGIVKQRRILRDERHVAAQVAADDIAHVQLVDPHRAGGHVIEAHEQVEHRRLARAGRADEGDRLTGLRDEGKALESLRAIRIGKMHIAEFHRAGDAVHFQRARLVRHLRCGIDDLEDAVGCGRTFLRDGADRAEGAHFRRRDRDRANHAEQVAQRVLTLRDPPGDEAEQRRERQAAEHFQHGIHARTLR